METYITAQIFKALTERDLPQFVGYVLIFAFIWLKQSRLEASLKNVNHNVVKSHAILRREQRQVVKRVEKIEDEMPDDNGIFTRHPLNSAKGGL